MHILSRSGRTLASALIPLFVALPALAAGAAESGTFIDPNAIKWEDAPPTLPKGAKIAVLAGDPGKAGPFVLRLSSPAGYKIPPHWHSQTENLTVISGTFYLGLGDKAQESGAQALPAGGFHYLPAKTHHYAFSKAPSVVQVHGEGPFDIHYLNEADDPQKAGKK